MTRPRTGPVLTASDYQQLARDLVDSDVWDFIEGGAESERTLRGQRRRVRPGAAAPAGADRRVHSRHHRVGVRRPTSRHRSAWRPPPTTASSTPRARSPRRAARAPPVRCSWSACSPAAPLEDIAAATSGALWLQLYWLRRRDVMADLIRRAADAGYRRAGAHRRRAAHRPALARHAQRLRDRRRRRRRQHRRGGHGR